jgi:intein-encoded DNA endonuclease-like protein
LFFLKSKDLEFACSILGALKALGLNPRLRREGKYYKVEVTSKALYLLLKEARENLEEYTLSPVDFLRGFYESEGNLQISRRKDRDSPSIRIRIVNTSRALLEFIQKLLRGLGIESSIRLHYNARRRVKKGKEIVERDCYVLDIHGGGRVVRFLKLVRSCIYRKGLPFLLEELKKYKLKHRLHVRVAPDVVSDNRGNEV